MTYRHPRHAISNFYRLAVFLAAAFTLAASGYAIAQTSEPRSFVRGSWKELRQAFAGRVAIVHFWGLTCGPCRIEMPEWGKLRSRHADLKLVTIHAERIPSDRRSVTEMLGNAGLGDVENWLFADSFQEPLRYEIDPTWQGELPRTLLVAADGTVTVISGTAEMGDVEAWLKRQTMKQESKP